jgi:hypothetical protein
MYTFSQNVTARRRCPSETTLLGRFSESFHKTVPIESPSRGQRSRGSPESGSKEPPGQQPGTRPRSRRPLGSTRRRQDEIAPRGGFRAGDCRQSGTVGAPVATPAACRAGSWEAIDEHQRWSAALATATVHGSQPELPSAAPRNEGMVVCAQLWLNRLPHAAARGAGRALGPASSTEEVLYGVESIHEVESI